MKRCVSLLLAIFMIWGTTARISATPLLEDTPKDPGTQTDQGQGSDDDNFDLSDIDFPGGESIMPASITPSTNETHEYRFYASEADADAAQAGDPDVEPIDTKFVRTDGILENRELLEKKDELFAGWFYKEAGEKKQVNFGKQGWIEENKNFYVYPKRSKVIAVFFAHGSVVHKSTLPDADGYVSINDQPGVGEAGRILKGWSMDESFETVEAAEMAKKLFRFKEDVEPTPVDGTLMLHAIFEYAIRVSFDTHGAGVIPEKNIKAGDLVEVPDSSQINKEGYEFEYWYVLEDDENSADGQREVKLSIKTIDGIDYFEYNFKKDTTVHVKWKGQEVPFSIVFMVEKRPDQIKPQGEKYTFLGSFTNEADPTKQITKGIAGSEIIFDDTSSTNSEKVTSLDKDQFKSYFEEADNTKNLLKYAGPLGLSENQLKGLHVNKEKTNEVNPVIEGNGLTTKVIYLDRDPVNLAIYDTKGDPYHAKPGDLIEDATTNSAALGGFKYGQILKEKGDTRGWDYLIENYAKDKDVNKSYLFFNYKIKTFYTAIPFATEDAKVGNNTAYYMTRGTDAWEFKIYRVSYGFNKKLITIPFKLPADKQDLQYENALQQWIANADGETLKNHLLPSKDQSLITKVEGVWEEIYMQTEDYPLIDGYETINKDETYPIQDQGIIDKIKTLTKDNSEYFVVPVIYRKQKFNIDFNSKATGEHARLTVYGIPYNCTIVNPENPVEGDPNVGEKAKEVENYLARFTKAEVSPETKEVTNLETVTKNQAGHLFMGWYLDPGYTIPFDEHMPMPANNLQVFAKWEPLYHYIKVHHLPAGTNGVNEVKNITELKVAHDQLIDTQADILKNPPILEGRSKDDFQGWETYGDVKTEVPYPDGKSGGVFLYKFNKPVTEGFHLYPRWYANRVGVVYAYNFNESDRPLEENEVTNEIMQHLDKSDKADLAKEYRYYMSEYKYPLGAKVRLRAPLGWNTEGMITEPVAPEGTKAHGKVFLGWKVMYRDKSAPFAWHTVNNIVYYNSEIEFTDNNISHRSDAKKGDAVGVMVLVAQWADEKIKTNLTLHRNYDAIDKVEKVYDIAPEKINRDWTLPDVEDAQELPNFKRENYKFLGWNDKRDGTGKLYQAGDSIYIDETYAQESNHLYAQWERIKDLVGTPKIDGLAKGDKSVKITPPDGGDTLVITFPGGGKPVTLTKDKDGDSWTDEAGNPYVVTEGKIEVPVPDNGTLTVGDIVTAQGKDSSGTLADSAVAEAKVGQSDKQTPRPQFAGIAEGDTSFKIKPVDQKEDGIITDRLVITINQNDAANSQPQIITLTRADDGTWTDGDLTYTPDAEGYLTVASISPLTQDFSLAATGEDTKHGHLTSNPTSRSIKAKPCNAGTPGDTPGQGGSSEIHLPGNPWISPENISLIKQLKLNQADLVKKQPPAKTVITPAMARLPKTGENTGTTTYLGMLALLLGLFGLYLAKRRS